MTNESAVPSLEMSNITLPFYIPKSVEIKVEDWLEVSFTVETGKACRIEVYVGVDQSAVHDFLIFKEKEKKETEETPKEKKSGWLSEMPMPNWSHEFFLRSDMAVYCAFQKIENVAKKIQQKMSIKVPYLLETKESTSETEKVKEEAVLNSNDNEVIQKRFKTAPKDSWPILILIRAENDEFLFWHSIEGQLKSLTETEAKQFVIVHHQQLFRQSDQQWFLLEDVFGNETPTLQTQQNTKVTTSLRSIVNPVEPGMCVICLSDPAQVILLPCRHFSVCLDCWCNDNQDRVRVKMLACPVCRTNVKGWIQKRNQIELQ